MSDELEICAAAFFRIKGKEVVTEQEFELTVSLELKWLSVKESKNLIKSLIAQKILIKSNNYLKPAKDFSTVQVPIAYRPSDNLKKQLSGTIVMKETSADAPKDLFVELMDVAVEHGIPKGKFVSESNVLKKKLGVETYVAALLILRDNGANIEKWKDRAYAQILGD